MDVKLTSASSIIPYLDKNSIEEYSNLKFYSEKGEVVKMLPILLLCSLLICFVDFATTRLVIDESQ